MQRFLSIPNTNRSGSANRAQSRNFFQKIQLPQASQDLSTPFDFSSCPITTQKFDIDITEDRFLKLKEKIVGIKNSLNDCKKCNELSQFLSELEDIANVFTRNRVKMLNSFFEMYIMLQEEIKKNKDISSKFQKLNQEIDNNLDCLTDRKVANKLKGLKNEVKYKSQLITELTERITCLENSNELKIKVHNSKTFEFEQLEKEKQIFFKTQTSNLAKPCKDCAAKKIDLEALQSEIAKNKETINLLKTKNTIKDSSNPLVKSMIELKKIVVD